MSEPKPIYDPHRGELGPGEPDPRGGPTVLFRDPAEAQGWVKLPVPVLLSPRLDDGAVRLYALLCHHARDRGVAWPGLDRLADSLHCSRRHLQNQCGQLKDCGLVTVERRGLGRTNRYWIERLDTSILTRLQFVADVHTRSHQEANASSHHEEEQG